MASHAHVTTEEIQARRAVRPAPAALPARVELRTRATIASEADARAAALREAYAAAAPSPVAPTPTAGDVAPRGEAHVRAPKLEKAPRASRPKPPTAAEKRAAAQVEARRDHERYLTLRAGGTVAPVVGATGGVLHQGAVASYGGRFLLGADRRPTPALVGSAAYPPVPRARPATGYGPSVRP